MLIRSLLISSIAYLIVINLFKILGNESSSGRLKKDLLEIKDLNKPKMIIEDVLNLSFAERIIKPTVDTFIKGIATVLPINEKSYNELNTKLSQAGIKMDAKDFRAMNVIIIAGSGIALFLISLKNREPFYQAIFKLFAGGAMGYSFRRFSLESKITQRKTDIKKQLPEVMDILSVSVVAGLGFDQALGYVVERAKGPLIDEFNITQREITLGKSRKESLNDLANRCQVEELKTFTNAIIQADEMGISMQNVLNSQSKMIREAYKQEIEEHAAKIPVKILIPMVLFIFPVIFIVLIGPAVPQIMGALGN